MRILSKIRPGLIALMVGASLFTGVVPAHAETDTLILTGAGTMFPGLTTSGGFQDMSFNGDGTFVLPNATSLVGCSWTGDDTIGTLTANNGLFDGACTTNCGVSGIHGGYNRSVLGVGIGGAFTSGCFSGFTFNGNCEFVPLGAPPVQEYAMTCDLTLTA